MSPTSSNWRSAPRTLFDIRPTDVQNAAVTSTGATGATDCVGNGVFLTPGTSCALGPNKASGQAQYGTGSVTHPLVGTSFDPNGGYYYARISYNF